MSTDPHDAPDRVSDAGIFAQGDVQQSAGQDAVGRDKVIATSTTDNSITVNFGRIFNRMTEASPMRTELLLQRKRQFEIRTTNNLAERLSISQDSGLGHLDLKLQVLKDQSYVPLDALNDDEQLYSRPSQVYSFFTDRCAPSGELLVVLGDPGTGKSTILYELGVAIGKHGLPTSGIATYISLSSWRPRKRVFDWLNSIRYKQRDVSIEHHDMTDWLAGQIGQTYRIDVQAAREWLTAGDLILLLDGLDEIPGSSVREACVAGLDSFFALYPQPCAIASRREEYESLSISFEARNTVRIEPLDQGTILGGLRTAGPPMAGLVQALDDDPEFMQLCSSPLILNTIATAYRDLEVDDILSADGDESRRHKVFSDYVSRQLRMKGARFRTSQRNDRQWLTALALNLEDRHTDLLLIENLTPMWCRVPIVAAIAVCIVPGLIAGIFLSFTEVHPVQIVISFIVLLYLMITARYRTWSLRNVQLMAAVGCVLMFGVAGAVFALTTAQSVRFMVLWPLSMVVPTLIGSVVVGLVIGVPATLLITGFGPVRSLPRQSPYGVLSRAVRSGSLTVIALWPVATVAEILVVHSAGTEEYVRIMADVHVFGPLIDSAILNGLYTGFVVGLYVGLGLAVMHLLSRVCMAVAGVAPIRYVAWLESMTQRRLLYRAGGGYMFIHALVRDHLIGQGNETG